MIRIVDYGVGNIQSFMTIFKRMGIRSERALTQLDLSDATHLVLPGVGHFDQAMQRLNQSGMRPKLEELVFNRRLPILGVCVGMQMLANSSDEGSMSGLNWIPGHVRTMANSNVANAKLPVPHMGWNNLENIASENLLLKGLNEDPKFYFLHSFFFDAKERADVGATACYGADFDAVVSRGNIYGVQFHPEKSHKWGAQLLKNFAEL